MQVYIQGPCRSILDTGTEVVVAFENPGFNSMHIVFPKPAWDSMLERLGSGKEEQPALEG